MSRRSPGGSPAVRTWAYIAHRADWLADPAHWAARTGEVEERLSDALHTSLTQRFVDKRTHRAAAPDRQGCRRAAGGDRRAGRSDGRGSSDRHARRVHASPSRADARAADKTAVARRRRRSGSGGRAGDGARRSCASPSPPMHVRLTSACCSQRRRSGCEWNWRSARRHWRSCRRRRFDAQRARRLSWRDVPVANIAPGPNLAQPRVKLDRALDALDPRLAQGRAGAARPLAGGAGRAASAGVRQARRHRCATPPPAAPLRAVAGALLEAGGLLPRRAIGRQVEALDPAARKRLARDRRDDRHARPVRARACSSPPPAQWRRLLMRLRRRAARGRHRPAARRARRRPAARLPPARPAGGARRPGRAHRPRRARRARKRPRAVRPRSRARHLDRAPARHARAADGAARLPHRQARRRGPAAMDVAGPDAQRQARPRRPRTTPSPRSPGMLDG